MGALIEQAVDAAYAAVDYSIPPDMVEKAVRAALAVFRNPTTEMVEAGQETNNLLENPDPPNAFKFLSRDEMTEAWQAMLDTELEPYEPDWDEIGGSGVPPPNF